MLVPKNATVERAERAGRLDRHGQPVFVTTYIRTPVRLQARHALVRGSNGDMVDIAATLWTDDMELRARDRLIMEYPSGDQYTVFDVSEEPGVDGAERMRVCRLVKVRALPANA